MTLLVFVNCKNNAGEAAAADDPTNKLYQSIIKLGNGFLDVFTSFGGLVADALGFKADPKKSEVKDYFSSIANKLEETVTNLTKLPKENSSSGGETGKDGTTNDTKSAVESAVGTVSGWIKEMAEAAKKAAEAAKDGGSDLIGKVVKKDAAGGKTADAGSVNGIADGIKGIVEAAKKSGVDGLKDVQAVSEGIRTKMQGSCSRGRMMVGAGAAAEAEKAAAAVSGVSGEQILKAIVEAAGDGGEKAGVKAEDAENPIDAAIGTKDDDAAAFGEKMKKDDQIAAAIVLRGMAKDGQFVLKEDGDGKGKGTVKSAAENAVGTVSGWIKEMAEAAKKAAEAAKDGGNDLIGKVVKKDDADGKTADAGSVNGIADGIKGIVEAAKKSGVDGLKDVQAVSEEENNKDAGKLFTGKNNAAGEAKEAEKAAAAVSGVSGEQILKAIVEAAGVARRQE
ncbi:hypothetical protein CV684_05295 [Borreliella burgdorferi]|uniref:variable large family protein n=1 Tax=Borreliella burgdorferi TaxID=139 RepID=UPI000D4AD2BA|nr:variable large family protein [Borreliella burgdorferi]PRQ94800.1 hypothetical protein CV684_05295 [Borreliella burgdorferi]